MVADMNKKQIMRIFRDTAYIRTGGSKEELKCAEYIKSWCESFGGNAVIEPFGIPMGENINAELTVDGVQINCKGYMCAGSGSVSAPLYYLTNTDKQSLSGCKGKIVLIDGYIRRWIYKDICENGAVGFITYDGNANYTDRDIDLRELRMAVTEGLPKLPCVNINVKDAIKLVKNNCAQASITLSQNEFDGESRNVVLELKGDSEETIVFTAHYDSTSLSQGAYDNMSGSIGLLAIAEHYASKSHRRTLRFVWCGSEERGLCGSKAYCEAHENELDKTVLNINLDMIGSVMGGFIACCTSEDKLVSYIEYMASELGFGIRAKQDVYSSDSTPFADRGIPAVSFARIAPNNTATIHNSYDTAALIKPENMTADIAFITSFAERMINAVHCPVAKEIPDKMKEELDYYLLRKRRDK